MTNEASPTRRYVVMPVKMLTLAVLTTILLLPPLPAMANQREEDLSDSVRTQMRLFVRDRGAPQLFFDSPQQQQRWLNDMSQRLLKILPRESVLRNDDIRLDFLTALHYEATRAGIDPQLMLAIVHVESAFRKYAISSAGARGFMQVMPFWQGVIGDNEHNLFKLRTNLRYGAVIFRHYLDKENGDMHRALARYNGSLGRNTYPDLVFSKKRDYWTWEE